MHQEGFCIGMDVDYSVELYRIVFSMKEYYLVMNSGFLLVRDKLYLSSCF